ncbi:MAG: response regulator [Planctomycetaceae bacterium]|nr:response regulator [Planctomycetaceae bacterium]
MTAPRVLVVSRHQAFAEAVCRQLHRLDARVEIICPGDFSDRQRKDVASAEVAFVDLDAVSADGAPLYRAFGTLAKSCQVVLVCQPKDTPRAAEISRRWEVFDYMLIDSVVDPYRAAMLVERARSHCLPDLPEIHAQEKRQYHRILGLLVELRAILKSRGDHPVVDAINRHKADGSSLSMVDGGWLAGVYQHCLVDVICGRLKRLEHEFQASECWHPVAGPSDDAPEVLLVEDSEICADIARHILESHGLNVTVAPTAELARIELEKRTPSLIVMDVHLGTANGLRLVKALRQGGLCPDVPVIVCSADRMTTTVRLAARLNIQGYLVKPYVPNELVTRVKSVLAQSTLEKLCVKHEAMETAS